MEVVGKRQKTERPREGLKGLESGFMRFGSEVSSFKVGVPFQRIPVRYACMILSPVIDSGEREACWQRAG